MSDDIGQAVRDRLAATTQVMAYVKNPDNIFADVLKEGCEYPAVVVFVPGFTTYEDLNSSNRCGPAQVEVFAYGRDRKEANALAKVIRDSALPADLTGSLHGMDWQEVSLVAGPAEVVDNPSQGADQWRRITHQTFSIWANPL